MKSSAWVGRKYTGELQPHFVSGEYSLIQMVLMDREVFASSSTGKASDSRRSVAASAEVVM